MGAPSSKIRNDWKNACGTALDLNDAGLEKGFKAGFQDVFRTAAPHADIVILGDTDHSNYQKMESLIRDPNVAKAFAESGVQQLFIEHPVTMADDLNAYKNGVIDRAGYEDRYQKQFPSTSPSADGNAMRDSLLESVDVMGRFGIDIIPADFLNGHDLAAPDDSAAHRPLTGLEQLAHYNAEIRARLDDRNIAAFVEEKRTGPAVMMFGAAHGSLQPEDHPGDLDSNFNVNTRSLKIDLYPNRQAYDDARQAPDHLTDLRIGADKPELVYFIDEKTAYTTCDTPPALKEALSASLPEVSENLPQPAPAERRPVLTNEFGQ